MSVGQADVIVGTQFGDEGKGRIVDLYASQYDVVARFGGGDNAGHSIVVGNTELALRIVPSGVLNDRVELFIGGGTVVNLGSLLDELERLGKHGIDVGRIKISDRAHLVFPYHAQADRAAEIERGTGALGTTGRGIGPAYVDKTARYGILFADLRDPRVLHAKLHANLARLAPALGSPIERSVSDLVTQTMEAAEQLAPHVVDGVEYIHGRLAAGKRILIEGAQGSLLDVGYGTYPYVTSSHTIAGGACIGLGIGPQAIGRVIGVFKAYCTRVGAGPFPSELQNEDGERLRRQGGEFGTVTGRPRRCGWFDAVAGRYAAQLNGLTTAVVTKLDVLSGFERLGIVTAYRLDGRAAAFGAAGRPGLAVDVEELPGWSEPLEACRSASDLPPAARRYLERLIALVNVPVELVSVGRERQQLIRW
ncbi:MAG: adenylosuccinate synthase [Candidatus Eremiobacteraeota bacterium]|nr:adenylosuccinate synthase [Candidatus Eremiobacteraeota bacterium]